MAKAVNKSSAKTRLSLAEIRTCVAAIVGSSRFAETQIFRWLVTNKKLEWGAFAIDGVIPWFKGTREAAKAAALRNLWTEAGQFTINWEESWVRKQVGVFVFTVYGIWIAAESLEKLLLNSPNNPARLSPTHGRASEETDRPAAAARR
jgi:hypothetical protein